MVASEVWQHACTVNNEQSRNEMEAIIVPAEARINSENISDTNSCSKAVNMNQTGAISVHSADNNFTTKSTVPTYADIVTGTDSTGPFLVLEDGTTGLTKESDTEISLSNTNEQEAEGWTIRRNKNSKRATNPFKIGTDSSHNILSMNKYSNLVVYEANFPEDEVLEEKVSRKKHQTIKKSIKTSRSLKLIVW